MSISTGSVPVNVTAPEKFHELPERVFWPVVSLSPHDNRRQARCEREGKEPIGRVWGLTRWGAARPEGVRPSRRPKVETHQHDGESRSLTCSRQHRRGID
jgi:hypothetical protein